MPQSKKSFLISKVPNTPDLSHLMERRASLPTLPPQRTCFSPKQCNNAELAWFQEVELGAPDEHDALALVNDKKLERQAMKSIAGPHGKAVHINRNEKPGSSSFLSRLPRDTIVKNVAAVAASSPGSCCPVQTIHQKCGLSEPTAGPRTLGACSACRLKSLKEGLAQWVVRARA